MTGFRIYFVTMALDKNSGIVLPEKHEELLMEVSETEPGRLNFHSTSKGMRKDYLHTTKKAAFNIGLFALLIGFTKDWGLAIYLSSILMLIVLFVCLGLGFIFDALSYKRDRRVTIMTEEKKVSIPFSLTEDLLLPTEEMYLRIEELQKDKVRRYLLYLDSSNSTNRKFPLRLYGPDTKESVKALQQQMIKVLNFNEKET